MKAVKTEKVILNTGKSHFRPQENTSFHAQNEEVGTEGWKFSNFGDITQENNKERLIWVHLHEGKGG
jgi:hypothetical protein